MIKIPSKAHIKYICIFEAVKLVARIYSMLYKVSNGTATPKMELLTISSSLWARTNKHTQLIASTHTKALFIVLGGCVDAARMPLTHAFFPTRNKYIKLYILYTHRAHILSSSSVDDGSYPTSTRRRDASVQWPTNAIAFIHAMQCTHSFILYNKKTKLLSPSKLVTFSCVHKKKSYRNSINILQCGAHRAHLFILLFLYKFLYYMFTFNLVLMTTIIFARRGVWLPSYGCEEAHDFFFCILLIKRKCACGCVQVLVVKLAHACLALITQWRRFICANGLCVPITHINRCYLDVYKIRF